MDKNNLNILSLNKISHSFKQNDVEINVLKEVELSLNKGEVIGLIGSSGAGKTTLLQIAGLLEPPTNGTIKILDTLCNNHLSDKERTLLRRKYIGFVYQFHHLLPEFNALENVIIPQLIAGTKYAIAKEYAVYLLEKMGLKHRLYHRSKKMSGGEQQRVAIARALVNKPKILLAGEPTGNLDDQTATHVFKEMLILVKETGLSTIIATHNLELASHMDRRVRLQGGDLVNID